MADDQERRNKFELTERQTAKVQQGIKALMDKTAMGFNDPMLRELKSMFQPHSQNGFAELCGGAYCKCCQ